MMSATTKAISLTDASGPLEVSAFLKKPFQLETSARSHRPVDWPGRKPLTEAAEPPRR